MRFLFILSLCLVVCGKAVCQNTIGIPDITNYTKQQYNAGSQNWDIGQDSRGIMYFANNEGLLSFDGTFWRTYPLPNRTIVRSLAIDKNDNIYVGGQGEIGFFSPGINGDLAYHSLSKRIPAADHDFADVWNIIPFGEAVFFRSNRKIFSLRNEKITVYNGINWSFMGSTARELFAFDFNAGLVRFVQGKWQPFVGKEQFPANIQVSAILPAGKDSLLLTSLTNGIYTIHGGNATLYDKPGLHQIVSANIYGARKTGDTTLAFITNLAGCFITNTKGDFIQKLTKSEGLQNNNILSIFLDKNENLWLGLDNGVDMIAYNNAIKNIFPEPGDRNAGYTSFLYHNRLYLGTSTGLYTTPSGDKKDLSYTNNSFEFITKTRGQVWNLSEVNGKLLMGHNKGAFLISGTSAMSIDSTSGFWTFQPLHDTGFSPVMITGTYNGINLYNDSGNTFSNPGIHAHFESAKFVVKYGTTIWIAHPYKGLYKVNFGKEGHPFSSVYPDNNHILSLNHNHLFKVGNKMVLVNEKGIYEYSDKKNDFVPSAYFKQLFGDLPVTYLKEDQYGNIWFCMDKKPGVADMSGETPHLLFFPQLNNKILAGDFEDINVEDSANVLIAAEKGFIHLNYAEYKKHKYALQILIREVKTINGTDSLVFGGYNSHSDQSPKITYASNSLHFSFASPVYGQGQNIEYSYYLEGFDADWNDWTIKTEKDYTNLPAGEYVFTVRCRNGSDNVSGVATYHFTVLPPWYQTFWAYALYLLFFIFLVYAIHNRQMARFRRRQLRHLREQERKYEEEQRQLQYQHNIEIEKNEREIVQLKNEKLQAEIEQQNREEEQRRMQLLLQIDAEKNERELVALRNEKLNAELGNKNAELASNAMVLVQKGELLQRIKEELTKLRRDTDGEKESKDYKRIIKIIDNELDNNGEWENFARHFDDVHTGYLRQVKEKFSDITPTELKLCAYLRLNLSTKEIAQLMNISVRGVETTRYRLRKKLEVPNDVSLFDFLIGIT